MCDANAVVCPLLHFCLVQAAAVGKPDIVLIPPYPPAVAVLVRSLQSITVWSKKTRRRRFWPASRTLKVNASFKSNFILKVEYETPSCIIWSRCTWQLKLKWPPLSAVYSKSKTQAGSQKSLSKSKPRAQTSPHQVKLQLLHFLTGPSFIEVVT